LARHRHGPESLSCIITTTESLLFKLKERERHFIDVLSVALEQVTI